MTRRLDDHDLDWALDEVHRSDAHDLNQTGRHDTVSSSPYRPLEKRPWARHQIAAVSAIAAITVAALTLFFLDRSDPTWRGELDGSLASETGTDGAGNQIDQDEDEGAWKVQLDLLLTSLEQAKIDGRPDAEASRRIGNSNHLLAKILSKQPEHWTEVRSAIKARSFSARKPDVRSRIAFVMVRDPSPEGRALVEELISAEALAFGPDELIRAMQGGLKRAADAAHSRLIAAPEQRSLFWLAVRSALWGDDVGRPLLQSEFDRRGLDRDDVDCKLGAALALGKLDGSRVLAETFLLARDEIAKAMFLDDLPEARFYYTRLRFFDQGASGRGIDLAYMPAGIERFAKGLPDLSDHAAIEKAVLEFFATRKD